MISITPICLFLVLLTQGSHAELDGGIADIDLGETVADIESARKTIGATKEFLDQMTSKDPNAMSLFDRVVMYGTATSYMLSSVKDLVDIAMLLSGSASEGKELKFMKEQFVEINHKLDMLDHEFRETHLLIDWNTVRINVGEYENTIASLERYMKLILDSPSSTRPIFEDMFKNAYLHFASNAPERIYLAAIAKDGSSIFQENVFNVARKFYGNDLRKVRGFVGYIMRSIQRGLILETTYLTLKNRTSEAKRSRDLWAKRFKEMAEAASHIEMLIYSSWGQQYREDADKFLLREAAKLTNTQLSKTLHKMLTEKFPWRSWFVLTYTHTDEDDDDRYYNNCGEFTKVNVGGKVVIVNHRPPKTYVSNLDRVFEQVEGVTLYSPFVKIAKNIFQKKDAFNCHNYRFKGIFTFESRPRVAADYTRYRARTCYAIIPFRSKKSFHLFTFA